MLGGVLALAVLAVIALVIIYVIRALTRDWSTSRIRCPHCGIDFEKDVLLVGGHSVVSCPFCGRWVEVHKVSGKMTSRKISDTDLAKLFEEEGLKPPDGDEES
jgi:hypothetical protein